MKQKSVKTKKKSEEPEVPQATDQAAKDPGPKVEPLTGIKIELTPDGVVHRNFYGSFQNWAVFYGLLTLAEKEINAMSSGSPGAAHSKETKLLGHVITTLGSISNVLLNMQNGLNMLKDQVEELVNAQTDKEQ